MCKTKNEKQTGGKMNISKELLEKAKAAKTAEELLAMARKENIDMTEEEAAKAFAELQKNGELADEELDNVSGGGCGGDDNSSPDGRAKSESAVVFMYAVGQTVNVIGWSINEGTIKETKVKKVKGSYYPYYKVEYKSGGIGLVAQSSIVRQ